MDLSTYVPQVIDQTINYPTHYTITNEDYNDILNLLISQGDSAAEALAQIVTELLQAEADIVEKVSSENITAIKYSDGNIQVTVDGVAWLPVGSTLEVVLVPHTHGNISADGKLLDDTSTPIANAILGTDEDGNIVEVTSVSTATPSTLIKRDADGRAQVADPVADADIANKGWVDSLYPIGTVKIGLTNPFGAKGLLCNGEEVSELAYPDLYELLTTSPRGTWTANSSGIAILRGVAYGNGYWVAVGADGTLYYKSDPVGSWTANKQGTAHLYGVAYGNGYWVTVGASGTLYYKSDPVGSWTSNQQGTAALNSVAYGNGYWVAVGSSGTLYYKPDTPGGTWTSNQQGTAHLLVVAYGNGYWVTVGSDGALYYKSDPVGSWTSNNQGTAALQAVAYGNGYWVAVGNDGALYYKPDTPVGSWTSNKQGNATLQAVAYGNGYWVAVGYGGVLYYKKKALPLIAPDGAYAYIRAE